MRLIIITIITVLLNNCLMYSQSFNNEKCGTEFLHQKRLLNEPGYKKAYIKLQEYVKEFIANNPNGYSPKSVVTIPVVFHIVLSPSENASFPDTRCIENIATLNADFAGLNTHSMGAFSSSLKADCEIQFCLATISPTGSPTSGIERINYSGAPWMAGDNNLKLTASGGLDAWNPSDYFNIWVCNLDYGLTGYGTYPTSINNFYGMAIDYEYTGTTGSTVPYNLGGQATHEIGHCFNLPHIWGDSPGCIIDDSFTDTPTQFEATFGIPTGVLLDACQTSSPGIMYMNFMDYSDDPAYANFTPQQKLTMQALFAPGGILEPLTTSNKCGASVDADFIAFPTILAAGATGNFTNLTSGPYDSLHWYFQGGIPEQSTFINPSNILYDTPGDYDVTLIVFSSFGNDTLTKPLYIHVFDPLNPDSIYANFQATTDRLIVMGQTVNFEDLSTGNITNWHWLFQGGTPSSSSFQNPLNINYPTPGMYDVSLIVTNGVFTDTLCKQDYIIVTTQTWPDPNGFCDTISNRAPNESPLTFVHLIPSIWGYLPGHNGYFKKAYADKFTNYTFNEISRILVPVAKATAGTASSTVRFKVWSGINSPQVELGYKDILINNMIPYIYNEVIFNSPIQVNGMFFIGYELYYNTPQDTFVCYVAPLRGPGGLNTLYVKNANTSWQNCTDVFGYNTSLAIKVIGCLTNDLVNIESNVIDNNIIAYPSPSDGLINIDFSGITINTNIEIRVFDILGNEFKITKTQFSENQLQLDFSNQANGIYFLIFRNGIQLYKTKVSIIH